MSSPTARRQDDPTYDFVIVGSGFGGSVSALRLSEKGYRVLVLEAGKRFRDNDFPRTNWNLRKYLWLPALRWHGIQQITWLNDVMILHGRGVGGGSLVYANVLMEPSDDLFDAPGWCDLADWKQTLRPHYDTAKRMLGVTTNPWLTPADDTLAEMAAEYGQAHTFQPTQVGVFFGENSQAGQTVPDPYFGGEGPPRAGCNDCGGCMVGCRYNAKNTLVKNYLYLAEKRGTEIRAEAEVMDIRPLSPDEADGARYTVAHRRATAFLDRRQHIIRARHVVISAGTLGTLKLLFRCRDETGSLPQLSPRLGDTVRTNSEGLTGATSREVRADYSKGVAITSVFALDDVTHIEPVRFSAGSSFIRALSTPMIAGQQHRLIKMIGWSLRHPLDLLRIKVFGQWAQRSTILLIMQTVDNTMRVRLGRNLFTFFRRGLVSELDSRRKIAPDPAMVQDLTRRFATKTNGIPQVAFAETLFNIPTTAHILGGCPMGRSADDGVVDATCAVFGYPGLYVVDGSIMPANPGINPSLTIAALAEYAMSQIPEKGD